MACSWRERSQHRAPCARSSSQHSSPGPTSAPNPLLEADEDLKALYEGVDLSQDTIAYCRIGERSAHTWFALHEILGIPNVRNYDGSWTEYGSLVGVPVQLGDEPGSSARCDRTLPGAGEDEPVWSRAVMRSLVTLKALTFAPTGGIVAAATTSLPEIIGGGRNWDYRFCWLRDATLTLLALMNAGYYEEAQAWRDWLLRAVAGVPISCRSCTAIAGERRLTEWEFLASRIRRLAARADRQCARTAAAARRLRRGHGRALSGAPRRAARERRRLGAAARLAAAPRRHLATSPTRACGRSADRRATSPIRR